LRADHRPGTRSSRRPDAIDYHDHAIAGMDVRLVSMYPLSVLRGGLEYQCVNAVKALQDAGLSARLLDWYDPSDRFDVLHFYGGGWHEIAAQARRRSAIVVTALASARGNHHALRIASRFADRMARRITPTMYGRNRELLATADAVICSSPVEREFFRTMFGVPGSKLRIIPNGIHESRFVATPDAFLQRFGRRDYVLYVGNLVSRKNPLMLARVLDRLQVSGVFVTGTVPAEQDYADEFARFVSGRKGLLWLPGLDYESELMASAYAAAAAFCLPSTAETQPVSALEAMAAGTPVLLADAPYARQHPYEQAVRFAPTEQALAGALRRVLGDRDLHRPSPPLEFRWSAVVGALTAVYQAAQEAATSRGVHWPDA
jgi:glycosyltransferase involved in cell wall biosynthesis